MKKPHGQWCRRRASATWIPLAGLAVLLLTSGAASVLAQGREVPPTRLGAAVDADRPWGRRPDHTSAPRAPAQGTAEQALAVAQEHLASGRAKAAERALEMLIAQFPESPAAAEARRHLVALYRAGVGTSAGALAGTREKSLPGRTDERTAAEVETPALLREAKPRPATPSHTAPEPTTSARTRRGLDDFKWTVGDRVFFESGSAALGARERALITAQASWLRQHPETTLTLEGHADDPGPDEINAALAVERAEAIRRLLLKEGIASERIRIEGRGRGQPIALCEPSRAPDPACQAQNRRVVSMVAWPQVPAAGRTVGGYPSKAELTARARSSGAPEGAETQPSAATTTR